MPVHTIEIDEELYVYLVNNISDFGEPPNDVIKRLLGLSGERQRTEKDSFGKPFRNKTPKRKPKTSLTTLVKNGFLNKNDELRLVIDGNEACRAKIDGDLIRWEDKLYSMSSLAVEFLQKGGYETYAARGPAYWFKGTDSIMVLWEKYLNSEQVD